MQTCKLIIQKITQPKTDGGMAQMQGPEFKPQYHQKNKQTNKKPPE
jgi:hypothetical protein